MRFSSPEGEDETARAQRVAGQRAEWRVQRWYENKLTLRAVTFPIYAVEDRPAQISGSGPQGDDLTQLTIAHFESEDADLVDKRPRIEVTTSTQEPHRDAVTVARRESERLVHDEVKHPHAPGLSDAAITLWFRAHDRAPACGCVRGSPFRGSDHDRRRQALVPCADDPEPSMGRRATPRRPHNHHRLTKHRSRDDHGSNRSVTSLRDCSGQHPWSCSPSEAGPRRKQSARPTLCPHLDSGRVDTPSDPRSAGTTRADCCHCSALVADPATTGRLPLELRRDAMRQ